MLQHYKFPSILLHPIFFLSVWLSFYSVKNIFKISYISFLTHVVLRSIQFNLHVFGDFLVIFLSLISSLILLWSSYKFVKMFMEKEWETAICSKMLYLETIKLSEVSQRKTNSIWYHLFVESKISYKWTYWQNTNRLIDVEKLLVTKG